MSRRHRGGDRVFLDANVLLSAAYRAGSALRRLWSPAFDVPLLSSSYAIEEARRNLEDTDARERLAALIDARHAPPPTPRGSKSSRISRAAMFRPA